MIDTLNVGKVVLQQSLSPSDPEVERAAKFAVEQLNRHSKCFKDARLELINKALVSFFITMKSLFTQL